MIERLLSHSSEMDETKRITISSHNINGFARQKPFLRSLCDGVPEAIRAVQEHWLAPPYKKQCGVNQLRHLHPDFDGYGTSGMKKEIESRVRTGRPFGGTGFIYNKKYSTCIKPLIKYNHERVTALKLSDRNGDIIMVNGYMPFYNTKDLQNQTLLYQNTLAFIENIFLENAGSRFILLLDMNCNLYGPPNSYSKMMHDLLSKYELFSCFEQMTSFDPDVEYTRFDTKNNSYTLIDGIFLSESLREKVSNVRISKYGDDLSDHLPVELEIELSVTEISIDKKKVVPSIPWNRLTETDLDLFRRKMSEQLDSISVPFHDLLHGNRCCTNGQHVATIEAYYDSIVNAVIYADSFLPRSCPALHRPYWSEELNELKRASIDCCSYWKANGSPKSGPIYDCKRSCTLKYKSGIRDAKKTQDGLINEALHERLTERNYDSFWKIWRDQNREADSLVARVDGESTEQGIAEAFRVHFGKVYSNNDTSAHRSLKSEFSDKFEAYKSQHMSDDLGPCFFSWSEMIEITSKLKIGKSSSGTIRPEHVLNGSRKLLIHLLFLFNSMIQHGVVVTDFLKGTITPIVKDTQGDVSDCTNYRGITLGCLFSKMFETGIDAKMAPFLGSDYLQFGFKKQTSTSHALFVLKSTIDYYTMRNSRVFVSFLDCSKAFDRISHYGLFIKLMERGIPLCLLLIIIYWHLNMTCRAKWGSALSKYFPVPLGTKQGGISSPKFFSVYIDDMIKILRDNGIGCHLLDLFVACIMFADDLALLAPTRSSLQKMINLCDDYCKKFCLTFNTKKSKSMVFGNDYNYLFPPLILNGDVMEYVEEYRYLGTTIKCGLEMSFSARTDLTSFFRATNSILNVLNNAHEQTLVSLLYTNCVPILSYACAVKEYSASEMSNCNIAMNNAFRKIFGFKEWESIRVIRKYCGVESLYIIFKKSQDRFRSSCSTHSNPIIRKIVTLVLVE